MEDLIQEMNFLNDSMNYHKVLMSHAYNFSSAGRTGKILLIFGQWIL